MDYYSDYNCNDVEEGYDTSLSSDDEFYDVEDFDDYAGVEIEPPNFITPFKPIPGKFSFTMKSEDPEIQIKMLKEKVLSLQDEINTAYREKCQLTKHLQDMLTVYNERINSMIIPNTDSFLVSNFAKSKKTTLSTLDMIERLSRIVNIGISDIVNDLRINLDYPFYKPLIFYDNIESYPIDKVDLNYIDPRNLAFWHTFNRTEKE